MDWSKLELAHAANESSTIPAADLKEMICRAMTPSQFHWLAWAFALQGETALWMHTLTKAMQVLCKPERLTAFINEHFLPFTWVQVHENVEPHVQSMSLLFGVRLAYKAVGDRTPELLMLGNNVGTVHLMPRACEEHSLPAR